MRPLRPVLIVLALAMGPVPALAFNPPGFDTPAPIEHVQEARYADNQSAPYAMNYADDAARTLGVRDGHLQVFDAGAATGDPLVPSVKGGLDSGRPMLQLQWH